MNRLSAGAVVMAAGTLVLLVVFEWRWIALAAFGVGGWKLMLRRAGIRGRRRPKSSWAKLLEAFSLVLVAWNTRGLVQKPPRRRPGFPGMGRPLRRVTEPDNDGFPEGY